MSNIIYAPKSWNPVSGCSPVSEGCANCWAKAMARRHHQDWGHVELHHKRLDQPLHWRKPRTVAVAFMGDLWHKDVPDEFIDKVFAVMALTPQHTYLLLTKRPERMREYLAPDDKGVSLRATQWQMLSPIYERGGKQRLHVSLDWPLPNVWLGVSVENQARADERIPLLLETPAAHRWVSLEPLLGAVNLYEWLYQRDPVISRVHGSRGKIDWCVTGGESGPKARPCELAWIRDVRDQCKAAGVACFVKQASGLRPGMQGDIPDDLWKVKELPDALQRP